MSLSPASQARPAAITASRLQLFATRCDYTALAPKLNAAAKAQAINTPRRVAHWLGQLHHESGGLLRLEESLSYSADRLCAVWPSRFPDQHAAAACAHNPRALAEHVYGGRMGNCEPGDGWRFRGRGFLQITGRAAYARASAWAGADLIADPDRASDPATAATIAAGWWAAHGCNALADADDVLAISRTINLGDPHSPSIPNGLDDRRAQVARAKTVWRP